MPSEVWKSNAYFRAKLKWHLIRLKLIRRSEGNIIYHQGFRVDFNYLSVNFSLVFSLDFKLRHHVAWFLICIKHIKSRNLAVNCDAISVGPDSCPPMLILDLIQNWDIPCKLFLTDVDPAKPLQANSLNVYGSEARNQQSDPIILKALQMRAYGFLKSTKLLFRWGLAHINLLELVLECSVEISVRVLEYLRVAAGSINLDILRLNLKAKSDDLPQTAQILGFLKEARKIQCIEIDLDSDNFAYLSEFTHKTIVKAMHRVQAGNWKLRIDQPRHWIDTQTTNIKASESESIFFINSRTIISTRITSYVY